MTLSNFQTGIYAIENLYNGRVYVGATKSGLRQRWRIHLHGLHDGRHDNIPLAGDAKKFGACVFRCFLLQALPATIRMAPFEQFWIDYLCGLGVQSYNTSSALEIPYPRRRVRAVPTAYRFGLSEASWYCYWSHGFDVSISHIYKAHRLGLLPSFFDGRAHYYSTADLDQFCAYLSKVVPSREWRMRRTAPKG